MKEKVYNGNSLYRASKRIRRAAGWKEMTQKYLLSYLQNFRKIQRKLESNDKYILGDGNSFVLNELGKKRVIQTLPIQDIIIQHSLTDEILYPILTKYLIYDNGASQINKGLDFTRKRFEKHIHDYYRIFGTNKGYLLKIDFSKYFDNIDHEKLLQELKKNIKDVEILKLINDILDHYIIDVSYSNDPEIQNKLFNSLEYREIPKELRSEGKRFMHKSIGIGSPVSQILGIYFPSKIDTYCKYVKGIKWYDAYMDDRVIISSNKEYLQDILDDISKICLELGIFVNKKKTQIIQIDKPFTFLKIRYKLTKTGKLVRRIPNGAIKRERRKIYKLSNLVVSGDITLKDFEDQYKGWLGDKKKFNAYNSLKNLHNFYKERYKWILKQDKKLKMRNVKSTF